MIMVFFKKTKSNSQFYDLNSLVTTRENLAVGTVYECKKNHKKNRQQVLKKMKIGSPVDFEFYYYGDQPAYLLIDRKTGLDFGNLGQEVASSIFDQFSKCVIVGTISDFYDNSAHVRYEIYGEAFFNSISRKHVNVLYREFKNGRLLVDKKLMHLAYVLSDKDSLTFEERKIVSALRYTINDIFNDDFDSANKRIQQIDLEKAILLMSTK